jgi:hypothetical protein
MLQQLAMRSILKLGVIVGVVALIWRALAKKPAPIVTSSVSEGLSDFDPPNQHDVGDLYGVAVNDVVDAELLDDDGAMDEGQNWLEALETSAAENGPRPEQALEMSDDDRGDMRDDVPVADRGSGGPAGL